jgi:hypothetical protein
MEIGTNGAFTNRIVEASEWSTSPREKVCEGMTAVDETRAATAPEE